MHPIETLALGKLSLHLDKVSWTGNLECVGAVLKHPLNLGGCRPL